MLSPRPRDGPRGRDTAGTADGIEAGQHPTRRCADDSPKTGARRTRHRGRAGLRTAPLASHGLTAQGVTRRGPRVDQHGYRQVPAHHLSPRPPTEAHWETRRGGTRSRRPVRPSGAPRQHRPFGDQSWTAITRDGASPWGSRSWPRTRRSLLQQPVRGSGGADARRALAPHCAPDERSRRLCPVDPTAAGSARQHPGRARTDGHALRVHIGGLRAANRPQC